MMKKIGRLLLYVGFFSSVGLSASAASAEVYFVSTEGDDASNGAENSPFKTIQQAVDVAQPGDTVYVRGGTYEELVRVHDKGNATDWITIQPYQSEHVAIDGEDLDVTSSKRAGFSVRDSKKIHISGFEIKNIKTASKDDFPAGILVRGNSQHVKVTNNDIHHIENTHEKGNAHGILVYGNDPQPLEDVEISENKVHDLTLGKSESLTLNGNVDGFLIDQNEVYDNNNIGIDVAGHYGACSEEGCLDYARNGTISNNQVTNNSSANNIAYQGRNSAAGIYVDGGANVTIEKNYVAENNYGISVASENNSNVAKNIMIQQNKIVSNDKTGLIMGGSSKSNGGAHNIQVLSNQFIGNDVENDHRYEVTVQHHVTDATFQGNIYYVKNSNRYMYISTDANPELTISKEKTRRYR